MRTTNNIASMRSAILQGLGETTTTSPMLAAIIAPAVNITPETYGEILVRFMYTSVWINRTGESNFYVDTKECETEKGGFFYEFATHNFQPEGYALSWNQVLYQLFTERYYNPDPELSPRDYELADALMEDLANYIIEKTYPKGEA